MQEPARSAVELESRRRVDLDVSDQRPQDDPGSNRRVIAIVFLP